ncbi:MAG: MBOAT family protein [Gemmataceae bacterium]|nr:MBOAT family protein [Gemmataceae bacterium]MDW8266557.1 MBOAT family protein [Gemmataceae bacterium]
MNFASKAFFLFLPVVLLIYHLLPTRTSKYRFLLVASWVFYMSWNPWFIWVIVVTSIIDYACGVRIESAATPRRRRLWLWISVVSNLGLLAYFKYANFFIANSIALARQLGWPVPDCALHVILPLGISFHTFQGLSYTLDVYRGKISAVRSFTDFALFVAFFPQLVAGPIVRASEFLPQMTVPPPVTPQHVVEGLHWFLIGLFKKVFIADRLAQFVDPVFAQPELYDAVTHRWAILAYAAQIYCDFSGYSDLAIGTAKWFGFELPQNFNFPYLSASITEFWKRWHMTLSTWMRDYLYISLGGSRRGNLRTYVNLLATMTLCGLWHGASWNYVLWGLYNGVLLAAHRAGDHLLQGLAAVGRVRQSPAYRLVAILTTFLMVAVGLVMVRSQSPAGCWLMERSLLGWPTGGASLRWVPTWVPLLVGLVVAGHLFSGLREVRCGFAHWPALPRAVVYAATICLLVAFGPGSTKAFIYFQF